MIRCIGCEQAPRKHECISSATIRSCIIEAEPNIVRRNAFGHAVPQDGRAPERRFQPQPKTDVGSEEEGHGASADRCFRAATPGTCSKAKHHRRPRHRFASDQRVGSQGQRSATDVGSTRGCGRDEPLPVGYAIEDAEANSQGANPEANKPEANKPEASEGSKESGAAAAVRERRIDRNAVARPEARPQIGEGAQQERVAEPAGTVRFREVGPCAPEFADGCAHAATHRVDVEGVARAGRNHHQDGAQRGSAVASHVVLGYAGFVAGATGSAPRGSSLRDQFSMPGDRRRTTRVDVSR